MLRLAGIPFPPTQHGCDHLLAPYCKLYSELTFVCFHYMAPSSTLLSPPIPMGLLPCELHFMPDWAYNERLQERVRCSLNTFQMYRTCTHTVLLLKYIQSTECPSSNQIRRPADKKRPPPPPRPINLVPESYIDRHRLTKLLFDGKKSCIHESLADPLRLKGFRMALLCPHGKGRTSPPPRYIMKSNLWRITPPLLQ